MIQASTLRFLTDLAAHNDRSWMDDNRQAYLAAKADFEDFISRLITQLATIEPGMATLSAKDCTFRVNRDIRFSKNKSPYKTNMGAFLAKGGKNDPGAGYYFHLEPGKSFIGGGSWMPEPDGLKKIRQEIDYDYDNFRKIITGKSFTSHYGGLQINGDYQLSRPPRGYDENNPAIEWIKMKCFVATKKISDEALTGKTLVKDTVAAYKALQPLINFINTAIQ